MRILCFKGAYRYRFGPNKGISPLSVTQIYHWRNPIVHSLYLILEKWTYLGPGGLKLEGLPSLFIDHTIHGIAKNQVVYNQQVARGLHRPRGTLGDFPCAIYVRRENQYDDGDNEPHHL